MNSTHEITTVRQRPFIAGFWLIPAIPVFALIFLPIMTSLGVDDLYTPAGVTVMFIVHFSAGYMWAQSLGLRSGLQRDRDRTMNIFGGLGFALGVVGLLIFYKQLDDVLNSWLSIFKGVGNLEFGALFAPWTGLACGISGFALGIGLKDWKLSLKLLALGFVTGVLIYLAIMFTMQLLGFQVGSGKPVMLPTTFLSMWVTALVGSELFGRVLRKSNPGLELTDQSMNE